MPHTLITATHAVSLEEIEDLDERDRERRLLRELDDFDRELLPLLQRDLQKAGLL